MTLALLGLLLPVRAMWEPFTIPAGSMVPTLLRGDYVLAWQGPFAPARGDVVVFRHPVTGVDFVKRVVGLPGDRVRMVGGVLHLDGAPVALEPGGPYVDAEAAGGPREGSLLWETLPGGARHAVLDLGPTMLDDTEEFVVPAQHVFVLGDNRDNSTDSRVPQAAQGVGLVPMAAVTHRADLVVLSFDPDTGAPRPGRVLAPVE